MLGELKELFREFERDESVRVVVLRSEGPVFSSGHDLNELVDRDDEAYTAVFALCTEVMEAIRLLPKPVIAQVQGLATAAGCQLVATCDLAVAAESAAFATPGVQIGLFCTTPGVALARSVATTKKAMEMLLTGTPVPASEALEIGLINRVVPDDELEANVAALARQIASASAQTLAIGKPAFYRQIELDRPAAYDVAQKSDGRQPAEGGCPRGHQRLPAKARPGVEVLRSLRERPRFSCSRSPHCFKTECGCRALRVAHTVGNGKGQQVSVSQLAIPCPSVRVSISSSSLRMLMSSLMKWCSFR